MQTILTGIRANEEPTIGNFLGAYTPMINLAHEHPDCRINMFVPDLHSFTTPVDHSMLYGQIIKGIKYYIAAGLDINNPNVHIYRQSHVPAHSELCWILDCFTPYGEASRMTQFKEKSTDLDNTFVSVGLFNYPILMAADILLYDATYIPLGEDQFQHLELARNIAIRMNNKFEQELFTIPASEAEQVKFMHLEKGLRIRSLVDPNKKMSKSSKNEKSKISLNDDPKAAAKKIMSATTDSVGVIKFDMINQPGISNLLQIESLLNNRPLQDVIADWAGQTSYGDLKRKVAESVEHFLANFQEKVAAISDDDVEQVLIAGEAFANEVANVKLHQVQKAVGLRR